MNEQKTQAEITSEILLNMPVHSTYKPVPDLPIPLAYGVLIKPMAVQAIQQLDSGLYTATGNNTQPTCEGVIMGVGPLCNKYMRNGLKCQYSSDVKTSFYHRGVEYMKCDEFSVHFIIPTDETTVNNGIKDPRQVRREKSIAKQKVVVANVTRADANEMDKSKDKTKGKIRKAK